MRKISVPVFTLPAVLALHDQKTRASFDLIVDFRNIQPDDAKADHDAAADEQQKQNDGGKAGFGVVAEIHI